MKKILSAVVSASVAAGIFLSGQTVYAVEKDSMAGMVSTESGRLNVRKAASSASEVVSTLPKNGYVTLIKKENNWWKVEYSDGKYGYCHGDYISVVSDDTARISTKSGNLNVRSGAGKSYPVIDTVSKDENVIILSSNGYWARILYDGAKVGCVSADYLSLNENGYSAINLSVPDYKQTDSRWSWVKIGSSGKTIGKIGCVTTGIAMMESYRNGRNIYPDEMVKRLSYDNSGNVYWPEDYFVNFRSEDYLSVIYGILKEGKPVLLGGKKANGSQHWVVVTGYNGDKILSPSGFLINDPGSVLNTNLGQFFAEFPYLYKFFHY